MSDLFIGSQEIGDTLSEAPLGRHEGVESGCYFNTPKLKIVTEVNFIIRGFCLLAYCLFRVLSPFTGWR